MPSLNDLIDRVERILIRHDELKRTNALLQEQMQTLSQERDSLRSRLNAARARIDVLLERLPVDSDAGKNSQ
jgi:FtsZ-binding cell division protein ZapB